MPRLRADSYRGRRWVIPAADELEPIAATPYPAFVTKLLRRRGIADAAAAQRYLFDDPLPLPDARDLPDAPAALERVARAIRDGERIAVFGDFDVDGVTATAILTEALRRAGAQVEPYIPDRFREGYGLNRAALAWLRRERGVTLVITADLGITATAEVAYAGELGQDVVIVDHHSVPPERPAAVATINPKRPDSVYPFAELSTGGLAYRLAPLIVECAGGGADAAEWLDLATLSTVADVVPLRQENRVLVREGLRAIGETRRPGLRALMDVAGLPEGELDTDSVAFALAPRLNAAGRLEHAGRALALLLESDPQRARRGAAALEQLNLRRRRLTREALARAAAALEAAADDGPLIFVADAGIPAGIVGLVAGRLAEERQRPAVVCELGEETLRASCRSIAGFDMAEALRDCGAPFLRHGGHAQAAGFTARRADLDRVRAALSELAAERLAGADLQPRLEVDGQVPLERLAGSQVAWLQRLAPFGAGNPAPTFVSVGLRVVESRPVGDDGSHLRLRLRAGARVWPGIGFGLGGIPCRPGDRVDAVWILKRNGGGERLELEVKDLAPASA